jgi:hypothetical protein
MIVHFDNPQCIASLTLKAVIAGPTKPAPASYNPPLFN